MAMVINSNLGAVNATRLLDQSGRDMATSMERLTSGLRINSAADDAAGLAVGTEMTKQIMGTDMAVRNANDGISLIQTIDGAVEEVSNMLQRQRELSVQSLSGTYTDDNRTQMDAEFSELTSEIARVANTTKFNDQALLDGSNATFDIHVGYEDTANDSITVTTTNITGLTSGAAGIATAADAATELAAIDVDITTLNSARATWGGTQNRLESTASNLQNISENTQ
ncbi:MAG: flagellin FliC, partial [Pseudomonadota bacterium]|nr:flagellin FliC [Pseudomonadota bacterium]